MQILYKIYSRDVEMDSTKCTLVTQSYSEEDQIFPSSYLKSGPFLNRSQLLCFIVSLFCQYKYKM